MGLMENQTGLKLNSSLVDSVFRVLGLQACARSLVTTHYPRNSGEWAASMALALAYIGNAFENQFSLSSLVLGEQTRSVTHSVKPEPHLNLFPDYM